MKKWFQRFKICCTVNEWRAEIRALKLLALLEGEVLAVRLDFSKANQKDYAISKEKMMVKMALVWFASIGDFQARKLRPGESLTLFVHKLKMLLS